MKIIVAVWILLFTMPAFATEGVSQSPKDYYNFLTQKLIADFREGIKLYNESKDPSAPSIKRGLNQNYVMVVKTTRVHFSINNYLNDQMYVNGKLVQRSTFGWAKTTWSIPFISEAVAGEDELDSETTKIILTALGSLTSKLEEVGMMCFAGCVTDVKKNNRVKIYNTLERQHGDCEQQLEAQSDTIKKYPSYQMVSLLHSTFNPEFTGLRSLIQKISESNAKRVKEFMTTKMLVNKNYETCVGVITSGTAADGAYNPLEKGMSVLKSGGVASMVIEEEVEKAQKICVKMEELKTCLVNLKKNLNTINSIKRSVNKAGYNVPLETLPEIKGIER